MKFRVFVDVMFADHDDAVKFLNDVEKLKDKPYKPLGHEKIACIRQAEYQVCYHDEDPPKPCGPYVNIDFDNPAQKIHKKDDITIP